MRDSNDDLIRYQKALSSIAWGRWPWIAEAARDIAREALTFQGPSDEFDAQKIGQFGRRTAAK